MIIITQPTVTDAQIDHIVARIEEFGLRSQVMRGETRVVIGVIGPDELIREKPLAAIPGVESVVPVMKPYKLVAQENGSLPPPVSIGDVKIGSGQRVVLISGPCSVESKEQTALDRERGEKSRRAGPARRSVQTAHLALQFPGFRRRRAPLFWPKRGPIPGCRSLLKSWTRAIWNGSKNTPIASRSARATCRTLPCLRKSAEVVCRSCSSAASARRSTTCS